MLRVLNLLPDLIEKIVSVTWLHVEFSKVEISFRLDRLVRSDYYLVHILENMIFQHFCTVGKIGADYLKCFILAVLAFALLLFCNNHASEATVYSTCARCQDII